jgi:3-phosphoshikimate 1-carboxyvinyltransferase
MSEAAAYPDKLAIEPLAQPPRATVEVPGSKSITNRALVLAALSSRSMDCILRGALVSDDTAVMSSALNALGFHVVDDRDAAGPFLRVGSGEEYDLIPARRADLFVGNSGTTMRFLTAVLSLGRGRYRLDGVPRMCERPIADLLDALRQLGVRAESERGNGCPPVVIEAAGLEGGEVRVRGDVSSQFLSGLLLAAPFSRTGLTITIEGPLVSLPYVEMTVAMLRQWGAVVEVRPGPCFAVAAGRRWHALLGYDIEPDASAASYFLAAAAVTGGAVTVSGLTARSIQGDVRFLDLLEEMGCSAVRGDYGLTVHGAPLRGIDVDMNDISDTVMTLAAVACFADGPTTIRNVAHIRHKETDRLAALAAELRRVGAGVAEFADGLTITPGPLHGAEVETYNDHRMAMSLALIGLKVPGVVIQNPACVAKTYPGFFDDLEKLRHA